MNGTTTWKPIECTFSDGGPDHNPRYSSVKIAQLSHFLNNDLDMSSAVVSDPGGSYTNPAERMMPLLNFAMYGVSLERSLQPVHETKIKNANTMEEIRTICKDDPDLTDAVTSSIKQCTVKQKILICVIERYTDGNSEEEIHLLFDVVKSIEDSLEVSMTSQQELKKCL